MPCLTPHLENAIPQPAQISTASSPPHSACSTHTKAGYLYTLPLEYPSIPYLSILYLRRLPRQASTACCTSRQSCHRRAPGASPAHERVQQPGLLQDGGHTLQTTPCRATNPQPAQAFTACCALRQSLCSHPARQHPHLRQSWSAAHLSCALFHNASTNKLTPSDL